MSDIKSAVLSSFDNEFSSATADTEGGFNNWFPEPGEHDCVVTGVTSQPCKLREYINSETVEHPATMLKFHYTLLDDPGSSTNPRSFEGAPFFLPEGGMSVLKTEGKTKQVEIGLQRLKGHCSTMLGYEPTSLAAAWTEVEEMLQGEEIPVLVKTSSRTAKNGNVYNTEYLVRKG